MHLCAYLTVDMSNQSVSRFTRMAFFHPCPLSESHYPRNGGVPIVKDQAVGKVIYKKRKYFKFGEQNACPCKGALSRDISLKKSLLFIQTTQFRAILFVCKVAVAVGEFSRCSDIFLSAPI